MSELMELGIALVSGRANPAWRARAERPRRLLAEVIGTDPVRIPLVPPHRQPPMKFPPLRPTSSARPAALEAAEDLVDGLARRRFGRLHDLLHDEVWALWPDGRLGRHPRQELVDTLEARPGKPARYRVVDRKSYAFAELKHALVRGLPRLYDLVLQIRSGLTVTLDLDGPQGRLGRLLLCMSPDAEGRWRARNLPLGSPDDAQFASQKPSRQDSEAVRIADAIVRRVVMGHAADLRAHTNQLMSDIWIRDSLAPSGALADLVAEGNHRLNSGEVVFMGTREVELRPPPKHVPRGALETIRREARDVLGRPLDRMDPVVTVTDLGSLDPARGQAKLAQHIAALLVRVEDLERGTEHRRLAALWL